MKTNIIKNNKGKVALVAVASLVAFVFLFIHNGMVHNFVMNSVYSVLGVVVVPFILLMYGFCAIGGFAMGEQKSRKGNFY